MKSSILLVLLVALLCSNSYQISYSQSYSDTNSQTVKKQKGSQSSSQAVKTIRFYRLNNQQQGIRLNISKKKTGLAGCHNLKRRKRVATAIQLGFSYCSLYSEKNCLDESIIHAFHSEQDTFSKKLTQGYGWQTERITKKDKKGVKVKSWYCE